jgi:nucleotide-binding universal stress UspA family protein
MSWHAIVVGVDSSSESATAAALAEWLARRAATECRVVHAVRDEWAPLAAVTGAGAGNLAEMQRLQEAVARQRVQEALRERVSPRLLESLELRIGPAPVVLQQAAAEYQAGLIVVGGKHHTALERWLGGSTSLNVVRAADRPVLVATRSGDIRRILVAADLSAAARPTLALAQRFARLVGAKLRVLSVFEPLPQLGGGVPPVESTGYYALSQEMLDHEIWPLIRSANVEKVVRHGMVVETLPREAADWGADLLVLGSHGKGWAQRILLGSVTERLINQLPLSLLIAPVEARVLAARRQATAAAVV